MSGFLRQLADRSLGLAPRLRSAAPSPQALAQGGFANHDTPLELSPADATSRAGVGAPAAGLEALDRWARAQSSLAPRGQAMARSQERDADAAAASPAPAQRAARQREESQLPSTPAPALREGLLPRTVPPRAEPLAFQADTPVAHVGAQAALRALQTQVVEPATTMPESVATQADRGERAARATHAPPDAQPRSWDTPARRPLAERNAPPDVHITIDRLEVVPPAPVPRATPPARSAALSLRAYLAARRSGLP